MSMSGLSQGGHIRFLPMRLRALQGLVNQKKET